MQQGDAKITPSHENVVTILSIIMAPTPHIALFLVKLNELEEVIDKEVI